MRRLALLTLCALSACQCLQPVDERPDAGAADAGLSDAGTAPTDAGGVDAGLIDAGFAPIDAGASDAGGACTTAADCPMNAPTQQFCGGLRPVCVNNHCLLECPTPDAGLRTCQSATADCLTCNGATRECARCDANVCTFTVDPVQGRCPAPFDDFQPFVVQPFSGRCGGGVVRDGGLAGVWLGSMAMGRLLLDLPALGGTCLGSPLGTQVPRALISCPACTFVAEGCE
ncbi:MAG: hypothetical protein IAE78_33500 [Myxococcus sp.]|nr:hypothetical protein [Myxococcus sp.]